MGKRASTVAEILRQTIQDSGETVTAIARKAGVGQPVLYRFVTGERDTITLKTADKLLAYFDLEVRPRKAT